MKTEPGFIYLMLKAPYLVVDISLYKDETFLGYKFENEREAGRLLKEANRYCEGKPSSDNKTFAIGAKTTLVLVRSFFTKR